MMSYDEVLADYEKFDFDDGRLSRPVYRRGSGPAVIVIHEMPGLHPLVVRFADRVAAAGMTVFCPVLFGPPGEEITLPRALGGGVGGVGGRLGLVWLGAGWMWAVSTWCFYTDESQSFNRYLSLWSYL